MRRRAIPQGLGAPEAPLAEAANGQRRHRHAQGTVWRVPEPAASRLWELGQRGIGGFIDAGEDDEGPWLLRGQVENTLHRRRKEDRARWPWRDAVRVGLRLAEALAAAEAASLSTGPLTPRHVALLDDGAHLVAEDLVRAIVGAPPTPGAGQTRAGELWWCPPEAEHFGAGENRYALGVILYELLAGEHPYGGAGLRHAMQQARRHEPPPFAAEVGEALPPGLQSFVLRALAPDPADRPQRARAMVEALEAALAGQRPDAAPPHKTRGPSVASPEAPVSARLPAEPSRPRWIGWAVTAAVSVGAVVFALREPTPPPRPASPVEATVPAVDAAHTRAEDCAACHPRHAAEWGQSVMGHSVKSPLFNALEALIEEQAGRDLDCPNGAGVLRRAGPGACRSRQTGFVVTGSGGEHWCVNCHAPTENLAPTIPPWGGLAGSPASTRLPVKDAIDEGAREGISCAFCHQVHGPVGPAGSGGYEGNPDWTSFVTGQRFLSRPEDRLGKLGIANSGYRYDVSELLLGDADRAVTVAGKPVHARPSEEARAHLRSAEFCGSCHDVRLFGTDVIGARRGEHFKRLRNAYTEYTRWAEDERTAGRQPATCQGCHMSTYPGVCVAGAPEDDGLIHQSCPPDMHFEPRAPGERPEGRHATSSAPAPASLHYFTSVDLPLAEDITDEALDLEGVDRHGVPLSTRKRRDMLLRRSLTLNLGEARHAAGNLSIPITIENVGAGHKVPAGFSQEREIWVHLRVTDGTGRLLYEVGRVDRNDEDLHDKRFLRVNTDPFRVDGQGRPLGLFGADVADGPDVPQWSPPPSTAGATQFRGKGLINFQNGFLRCVSCRGDIGPDGSCLPLAGERHRAERFVDGDYDLDTGECRSNLSGEHALFETYFPVGSLDADRGQIKAADAIIDTRSLVPHRPVTYTYELASAGRPGPFRVEARLMFRGFPPFLVRAFADYEAKRVAAGARPSGPLVTRAMMRRLERVELARAIITVR